MFDNYLGNKKSIEKLTSYLSSDGPGVLLVGKAGLGLERLALETAEELLGCSHEGNPDFLMVSPDEKGKIGVEDVVSIQELDSLKPVMSKKHVILIYGMECMNIQAQNKILKLLEDSVHTTIISVADAKSKILQTIISRMIVIEFSSLTEDEFYEQYVGNEKELAYILTRGCPEGITDERVEYYKPICEILSQGSEKELIKLLNLFKEKDNDNFFLKYRKELPWLFNILEYGYAELAKYLYLGEIGKYIVPEVVPDREKLIERMKLIQNERKISTWKIYTKDDFFKFIVSLI